MTRAPRLAAHRFRLVLLMALLALPAAAFGVGTMINFYANFNDATSSAPGTNKSFHVSGGSAVVYGPQDVFEIVFVGATAEGVLEIRPNPAATESVLECNFNIPAMGDRIEASWSMKAVGGFSNLDIRFNDVGDTDILDLHVQDDRHIVVGNVAIDLPLLPGETELFVHLILEHPVVGIQLWTLELVGPTQSKTTSGALLVAGLNVGSLDIVRKAGTAGGRWHVDNLLVTSQDPDILGAIPTGVMRK